ncbi:MAG: hypothetical protein NC048_02980 [Bacteroides sp.]|nr:hypothetical protein [Ruminococcus flavefaciens]MCM1554440.1 hypothetical protein [Bacteroides sp.]
MKKIRYMLCLLSTCLCGAFSMAANSYNGAQSPKDNPALELRIKTLNIASRGVTDLDISGCGGLELLDCCRNQIPLPVLYKAVSHRKAGSVFMLSPQRMPETVSLIQDEAIDLNPFLAQTVAGTEPDVEVLDLFDQPVPAYRYTYRDGRLSFQANGEYHVTLSHPQVPDYAQGTEGEPARLLLNVSVRPAEATITYFDCSGAETANNGVSALDVRNCTALNGLDCRYNELDSIRLATASPVQELHAEHNRIRLMDVFTLLGTRGRRAAYYFNPQSAREVRLLDIDEELDLKSEFTIDNNASDCRVYDTLGEAVSEDLYSVRNGMVSFFAPGVYLLELSNRAVTDYIRGGSAGTAVRYTYRIKVGGDAAAVYTVSVRSENTSKGTVTGGGTYQEGDYATVTATANSGYVFDRWENKGSFYSDQRNLGFYVDKDYDLTAYFRNNETREEFTVSVRSENTSRGTVTGGGTYKEGEYATVTATAKPGYAFARWENNGVHYSGERSIGFYVYEDYDLTAYFKSNETQEEYTVSVRSENTSKGTVTGGGTYQEGEYATVTATAKSGYVFDRWENNGSYYSGERSLGFYVYDDYDLTAYFRQSGVGNEEADGMNGIQVYAKDRVICLSEEAGEIEVFTAAGQRVYAGTATRIPVRAQGVYVVRVGTECRKVMVL